MPIKTEVYQRETPHGVETITVLAAIDDEGAEVRVIHERDGAVIADTIPHWGEDGAAGQRWVDRNRDACVADGYQLIEAHEDTQQ